MRAPADRERLERFLRALGESVRSPLRLYRYPSLILSKAARSAERDLADVELLLREGVVDWAAVEAAWAEVRASETGWLRHTPSEVER